MSHEADVQLKRFILFRNFKFQLKFAFSQKKRKKKQNSAAFKKCMLSPYS